MTTITLWILYALGATVVLGAICSIIGAATRRNRTEYHTVERGRSYHNAANDDKL